MKRHPYERNPNVENYPYAFRPELKDAEPTVEPGQNNANEDYSTSRNDTKP